jgi:CBS domain containing-hemolysin-like protein
VSASFAFVMISILHIVFGELVPKSLAIQQPVATTLFVAHPLRLFFFGMFPVIWVLNGFSRLILRGIGVQPANERDLMHSPEELKMLLLASARESGGISAPRKELIEGVFQFSKRTAKQIMVPRTDVHVLSVTNSIEQNLEIIRSTRHTRYPLCEGDLDRTIGLIHVKDILIRSFGGPGQTLVDFQRDVFYVPENTTVEQLLEQFIAKKTHLAIVVDEYGGASGIVSMENITEELFGQIQDEFDKESLEVEPLDTGQYKVRGDYLIEDLAGRLRVDLGNPPEETIGGYVVAAIGREVSKGDSCELGPLKLEVLEGARFRVKLVLVTPQTSRTNGDGKPE